MNRKIICVLCFCAVLMITVEARADELPLECTIRAIGKGNCEAFWSGFQFNSATGRCERAGVSGCSARIPFPDLESCSAACSSIIPEGWVDITPPSQCINSPWGKDENLKDFFAKHGVAVLEADITTRIVCRACGCPSSRIIKIHVREKDRDKVISLLPWGKSSEGIMLGEGAQ